MAEKDLHPNAEADPSGGGATLRDEQLQFKKRARRRLVGAIALALLAVIVLPMVMDQEPRPLTQDIQIRIPSQDTSAVSTLARSVTGKPAPTPLPAVPKPADLPPTASPAPTPVIATPPSPSPAAAPVAKPDVAPVATAKQEAPKPAAAPAKTSEAKPEADKGAEPMKEQWVVQLGAYQDQANVKAMQNRLKGLGLPSFTEKIDTPQGPRTRVRSGPFASREAAEKAQTQLKKLAIGAPAGGVVAQKP